MSEWRNASMKKVILCVCECFGKITTSGNYIDVTFLQIVTVSKCKITHSFRACESASPDRSCFGPAPGSQCSPSSTSSTSIRLWKDAIFSLSVDDTLIGKGLLLKACVERKETFWDPWLTRLGRLRTKLTLCVCDVLPLGFWKPEGSSPCAEPWSGWGYWSLESPGHRWRTFAETLSWIVWIYLGRQPCWPVITGVTEEHRNSPTIPSGQALYLHVLGLNSSFDTLDSSSINNQFIIRAKVHRHSSQVHQRYLCFSKMKGWSSGWRCQISKGRTERSPQDKGSCTALKVPQPQLASVLDWPCSAWNTQESISNRVKTTWT